MEPEHPGGSGVHIIIMITIRAVFSFIYDAHLSVQVQPCSKYIQIIIPMHVSYCKKLFVTRYYYICMQNDTKYVRVRITFFSLRKTPCAVHFIINLHNSL